MTISPSLPWQLRLRLGMLRLADMARVAIGAGGSYRLGPWIVLCQAESPRLSPTGDVVTHTDGGQLITADTLAQVARVYDPRIHRAAIIASEEGNPHLTGEARPAAGWIERVEVTPLHLWGLVAEIVDAEDGVSRLEKWISGGYYRRSVCIAPRQDIDGGLYLRHVALSSGYPEGQGGNPPLDWYWPEALKLEPAAPRLAGFDPAGMIRLAYDPTGGDLPPKEERKMDPTEVKSIIEEAMQAMMTSITAKLDAQGQATEAAMQATAEAATAQATALEARLSGLEAALAAGSKEIAEKGMRLSLQALVDQGKLPPAEVDAELAELTALPDQLAQARLSRLASRPAINAGKLLQLPDKMKYVKAPKPAAERISRAAAEAEIAAIEAGYITEASTPTEKIAAMDRIARETAAQAG